jgi:hypothetical protein
VVAYADGAGRAGAGVKHLVDSRRPAIRRLALQHAAGRVRWWPPSIHASCVDLLVEHSPPDLAAFRRDLERALGCRVAVYVAGQIPREAWGRILVETVAL